MVQPYRRPTPTGARRSEKYDKFPHLRVPRCIPDEEMMPDLRFDPSKAVTFDLTHGLVHLEGAPSRVLVPAEALLALAAAAGAEATAAFAPGRSARPWAGGWLPASPSRV